MFPNSCSAGAPRLAGSLQFVRTLRTRKPEYPRYKAVKVAPRTDNKKDHSTFFHRHLKGWLGRRNLQGEYYENKYYYVPQNNIPNYIVPDGNSLVSSDTRSFSTQAKGRIPALHPFPQNLNCKTASIVSDDMKKEIYSSHVTNGILAQELAHRYRMKISRVEAIIRLQKVKETWDETDIMTKDLRFFSSVMKKIFPIFDIYKDADNLTEIPTPQRTSNQRFLTISESEPFGPVDAARMFGLEPARDTLHRMAEIKEEKAEEVRTNNVIVGIEKKDDTCQFRFTLARSGEVGYRYGARRRDKKKDRGVAFDTAGKMIYTVG